MDKVFVHSPRKVNNISLSLDHEWRNSVELSAINSKSLVDAVGMFRSLQGDLVSSSQEQSIELIPDDSCNL